MAQKLQRPCLPPAHPLLGRGLFCAVYYAVRAGNTGDAFVKGPSNNDGIRTQAGTLFP